MLELHEVNICSTAAGLRQLADHFKGIADEMDKLGVEDYFNAHWHFQPENRPEIVVVAYSPGRNADSKIAYVEVGAGHGMWDRVALPLTK